MVTRSKVLALLDGLSLKRMPNPYGEAGVLYVGKGTAADILLALKVLGLQFSQNDPGMSYEASHICIAVSDDCNNMAPPEEPGTFEVYVGP